MYIRKHLYFIITLLQPLKTYSCHCICHQSCNYSFTTVSENLSVVMILTYLKTLN